MCGNEVAYNYVYRFLFVNYFSKYVHLVKNKQLNLRILKLNLSMCISEIREFTETTKNSVLMIRSI